MWAIAFRNGTLDRNAGRNVKRSADVSGNARHFCDCELNYTGYESERSGLNHWTGVTQATWYKSCGLTSKGLSLCFSELNFTGYEGERSGLNHWTGVTQGTWYKSCGYYGKWTSVLWARVQLQDVRHPSASGFCELNFAGYKHHLPITFYK